MTNGNDTIDLGGIFLALVMLAGIIGVPALLIWSWLPDSFTEPLKYGVIYSVPNEDVHFIKKPHDCDYDKAPLGDKECHFAKQVFVSRVNPNDPNSQATQVYIAWDKVEDK